MAPWLTCSVTAAHTKGSSGTSINSKSTHIISISLLGRQGISSSIQFNSTGANLHPHSHSYIDHATISPIQGQKSGQSNQQSRPPKMTEWPNHRAMSSIDNSPTLLVLPCQIRPSPPISTPWAGCPGFVWAPFSHFGLFRLLACLRALLAFLL